MQRNILVKAILLLVVTQLCYAVIFLEPLDRRLCRAQFVFKFQVVSASRKVCFRPYTRTTTESLPATTAAKTTTTTAATTTATTATTTKTTNKTRATTRAPTTKTITANSTPLTNTTLQRATSNLTTATPANSSHISTTQSTNSTTLNQTSVSPKKNRRKRCIPLLHQNIIIEKNGVFRGHDKLKKVKAVKEVEIKDISYSAYYSYIRLDLNFQTDLPLGEYLFIGRQIPNIDIKDQIFLKNPGTVVPWSKKLEQKLNKFDFVKDCKKQK